MKSCWAWAHWCWPICALDAIPIRHRQRIRPSRRNCAKLPWDAREGHMFEPKSIAVEVTATPDDTVRIAGKQLLCTHCDGEHFSHRRAKLNTTFAELFDLAWLNRSANVYVCNRC